MKDYAACEEAIEAYKHVFDLEESMYGGVNLLTLMFASEKYDERKQEIEDIWLVASSTPAYLRLPLSISHLDLLSSSSSKLNSRIARRGGVTKIHDYWQVASFFEVSSSSLMLRLGWCLFWSHDSSKSHHFQINVVSGFYALANSAAPVMYNLAAHAWMVETSMRNIQLIDKIRKQRESQVCTCEGWTSPFSSLKGPPRLVPTPPTHTKKKHGTIDAVVEAAKQDPQRIEFEFWCELFISASQESTSAIRLPCLVQSLGV